MRMAHNVVQTESVLLAVKLAEDCPGRIVVFLKVGIVVYFKVFGNVQIF